jgi:hypothetical protein
MLFSQVLVTCLPNNHGDDFDGFGELDGDRRVARYGSELRNIREAVTKRHLRRPASAPEMPR